MRTSSTTATTRRRRWTSSSRTPFPAGVLADGRTGMTALARVLIAMRQAETGASHDESLAELGRRIQTLLPGSG